MGGEAEVQDVDVSVETAEETPDVSEVFGMGGGFHEQEAAPTGEPPTAEPAAQSTWEESPLPAGHPYAGKYKTIGEFSKAYEASSAEGRRLAQETRAREERLQEYERRLQQLQTPPKQEAKEDNSFFGFNDQKHFQTMMQIDPKGTMQKMLEYGTTNSPLVQDKINQAIQDRLNGALAPYEEHRRGELIKAQMANVESRYDLGAPDSPMREAAARFISETPWIGELQNYLHQNHPGQNIPEIVIKLSTYDILRQELAALKKKLTTQRSQADSARPGAGGKAKVKDDGTPESTVVAAAEEVGGVDQGAIQAMIRAVKRHLTTTKKS